MNKINLKKPSDFIVELKPILERISSKKSKLKAIDVFIPWFAQWREFSNQNDRNLIDAWIRQLQEERHIQDLLSEDTAQAGESILWHGTKEQLAKLVDILEKHGCIEDLGSEKGKRMLPWKSFANHFQWLNPTTNQPEKITAHELSVKFNGLQKLAKPRKKHKALEGDIESSLAPLSK